MEIDIKRHDATEGAILGECFVDGAFAMFTLERHAVAVPPGRYPVRLTLSNRAQAGTLWTPDPAFRLPLVEDVPGRSGIRFHAGNVAANSDGCILVGAERSGDVLSQSRHALVNLIARIDHAEHADQPVFLLIEAPTDVRTLTV